MENNKQTTHKKAFGDYIRKTREHQGMSLQGLADISGITKCHIWDIEQAKTINVTVKTILGFAKAFNVDPTDIFYAAWESQV